MLYIAFVNQRDDTDRDEVTRLSTEWWNEGGRPAGMRTLGIWGTIGSDIPDVFVFEADDHDALQKMVNHWRSVAELDIYPARDLAAEWRGYGMDIA